MSDLYRFSLPGDYRARLVDMFPRVTPAQLERFDELVASDRLIGDDGEPHPAFLAWVQGVNGGGDGAEPVPFPVAPRPGPVSGGSALEVVR
jgi:hypothetical protein